MNVVCRSKVKGGPGQQRLFNILAVYAAKVNPKVA